MAKLKLTLVNKVREYTFSASDGADIPMVEYQVAVADESGTQTIAKLSRSAKKPAPEVGEEINGTVEPNEKYGPKIKEDRPASGGRGGWNNDPDRENRIMKQNALQHATARASILAQLIFQTEEDKKAAFDLAKDYLLPSNIMKAADMFVLYAKGDLKPGLDMRDVTESFPGAVEKPVEEPANEGAVKTESTHTSDISPDELPF